MDAQPINLCPEPFRAGRSEPVVNAAQIGAAHISAAQAGVIAPGEW
jgi:hypothetical protein